METPDQHTFSENELDGLLKNAYLDLDNTETFTQNLDNISAQPILEQTSLVAVNAAKEKQLLNKLEKNNWNKSWWKSWKFLSVAGIIGSVTISLIIWQQYKSSSSPVLQVQVQPMDHPTAPDIDEEQPKQEDNSASGNTYINAGQKSKVPLANDSVQLSNPPSMREEEHKPEIETKPDISQNITKPASSASSDRADHNLKFKDGILGWQVGGDPQLFGIGLDDSPSGGYCGVLRSLKNTKETGTLMQGIASNRYRGKRVRLSANIKTKDVTGWSGMWMRVDAVVNRRAVSTSYDDMKDRSIKGTSDWDRYEIVLDIPENSMDICFGTLLKGTGQIWMDDVKIDVVDKSIARTGYSQMDDWMLTGSAIRSYETGTDKLVTLNADATRYLKSTKTKVKGFGSLMKGLEDYSFHGKRIRMTAYIKSKNIANWAGMYMSVDEGAISKNNTVSYDNMINRPITGTTDWQKYEIVLDVPEKTTIIYYGISINGTGELWIDDLKFEIVTSSVPTTNMLTSKKELNTNDPSFMNIKR